MEKKLFKEFKINDLPPFIDSEVDSFFARFGNAANYVSSSIENPQMSENKRFAPPSDWNGPRQKDNKVIEILDPIFYDRLME